MFIFSNDFASFQGLSLGDCGQMAARLVILSLATDHCTDQRAMLLVQLVVCTVQGADCSVQCLWCRLQCAVFIVVQCSSVCSVQCAVSMVSVGADTSPDVRVGRHTTQAGKETDGFQGFWSELIVMVPLDDFQSFVLSLAQIEICYSTYSWCLTKTKSFQYPPCHILRVFDTCQMLS